MFYKARIKLTIWYLVIIMAISIFFSAFIYLGSTEEFNRILQVQEYRKEHPELRPRILPRNLWEQDQTPFITPPDPQLIEEAKLRTLESLIGINVLILILSSLAGYFLAGRTLKPIQLMVDEQNRFITDSSHELRTPLTSLRAEIEVALRNKNLNLINARKIIQSNLEEVLGLQALSDNLLELAQNGSFINKNSMKKVLLSEIIKNAVKKTENLATAKKIEVDSRIKNIKVLGIADRLTEVFVILLDNAIKYSLPKSRVEIISKTEENKIKILVIDNGIGIENEDLPYVFNRFYRASKSRSKKEIAGYGLGLSIAKKIIELHNGYITAESIPGEKTTFTVVLLI